MRGIPDYDGVCSYGLFIASSLHIYTCHIAMSILYVHTYNMYIRPIGNTHVIA